MAIPYPDQTRTVDPYSSYSSNIVNRLTRMITGDTNCLFSTHTIEVTTDSTDSYVVRVGTGQCFKDDVIVELESPMLVDFKNTSFYVDWDGGFDEPGYYYVVLDYTYIKAKPSPKASLKIIKPDQRVSHFNSQYLLLKVVLVSWTGTEYVVTSVLDGDPTITDNQRKYSPLFAGVSNSLPSFITNQHEGQIIYVRDTGGLYWGMGNRWEDFSAIRDNITTTGRSVGEVCYLINDGTSEASVSAAIATANETLGDCIVLSVGAGNTPDGQVRLAGRTDNVLVETGITILTGQRLYLSETQAGRVTNLEPGNYPQYLGRSIANSSGGTVTMWFVPWGQATGGDGGASEYDRYQDLLQDSVFLKMTVDSFHNLVWVDQVHTTTSIDVVNREMDGTIGETFRSSNLLDVANYDGSNVNSCQITAEIDNPDNITWYVTNNGDADWEQTTINIIHYFSDVNLPVDSTSAHAFTVGEIVVGGSSAVTGIINASYDGYVLLRNLTGTKVFTIAETITGLTSGETAVVQAGQTTREGSDIRVRADFIGTASVEDYGLLYDQSEWALGVCYLKSICDSDSDTKITTENSIDEDYIRMYTSGTQRLVITDTGLTGIGTASPGERLHVNGGLRIGFTANQVGGNIRFTGSDYQVWDTTGWTSIVGGAGGGGGGVWAEVGDGRIYYNAGNVGIGTANPLQKLQVNGTIRATAYTSASDLQLQVSTVNAIVAKDTTRRVGINTDNPTYRLEIGESNATPILSFKRYNDTILTGDDLGKIVFGSNDAAGDAVSAAYGGTIYCESRSTWGGGGANSSGRIIFQTGTGGVAPADRVYIDENGLTSLTALTVGNTTVAAEGRIRYTATNVFEGCDGTNWISLGGIWSASGANIYYDGGYCGIGTDAPSATLDVGTNPIAQLRLKSLNSDIDSGETYAQVEFTGILLGQSEASPGTGAVIRAVGRESWKWGAGGSETGAKLEFLTTDIGEETPDVKMVIESDGDVGIGQTSPSERLDIRDDSGNGAIQLGDTATSNEGTIKYDGIFKGYNGTSWNTLSPGWVDIASIDDTDSPHTLADEYSVVCDATSNVIVVNLPVAASSTGKVYIIKKIDASANTVTITPNGVETIEGGATYVLTAQYQVAHVVCDGIEWWVL